MVDALYQKNTSKIYAFSYFYFFLIIVPVIVPFFLSLGLSMTEVFIIQAVFGLFMALVEIPSAYLGDLWGRKNVLQLGSLITGVGFSFLFYAEGFWSLLFYEILLGIGASFISGADLSILYDSLGDERDVKKKAIGHYYFFQLTGEASAGVVCSLLMLLGYIGIIWGQAIVGWIPFFISLFVIEPPIERMQKEHHRENFKEVFRYIFLDKTDVRIIFINMVTWSLSTFVAVWIIQKYWDELSISNSHLGYIWAVLNLLTAFVSKYASVLELKFGSRKLLCVMALCPTIAYFMMGQFFGLLGFSFVVLFYFARGINSAVMGEAFNHRIPSKFRNTANSLSSFSFRMTFFVFGPIIGVMIDQFGMPFTLQFIGIIFLVLFFVLLLPMFRKIL